MSEKRGIPFYFHQETKVTTWTYPVMSPLPAASSKLVMQTHKDDAASVAAPGQTTVVSSSLSGLRLKTPASAKDDADASSEVQTHKDDAASAAASGQTTVASASSSDSKTPAKDNISIVLASPSPRALEDLVEIFDQNTGRISVIPRNMAIQMGGVPSPDSSVIDRDTERTRMGERQRNTKSSWFKSFFKIGS